MCDHKPTQTVADTANAESVDVPTTAPKVDIAYQRTGKLDHICLHDTEGHMSNDNDDSTTSTTEEDDQFDASSKYEDSPPHSATRSSLVKFDLKAALALRNYGIHVPVVDIRTGVVCPVPPIESTAFEGRCMLCPCSCNMRISDFFAQSVSILLRLLASEAIKYSHTVGSAYSRPYDLTGFLKKVKSFMGNDCDRVSKIENELRNFYSALPQMFKDVETCVKGRTYGPGVLEAMRDTQANMEDNIARMCMHASVERECAGQELEAWRDQISSLKTNVKDLQKPDALCKVDVMLIIKVCRLVQATLEMDAEFIKNFKGTNEMEAEKIEVLNASLGIMEGRLLEVTKQKKDMREEISDLKKSVNEAASSIRKMETARQKEGVATKKMVRGICEYYKGKEKRAEKTISVLRTQLGVVKKEVELCRQTPSEKKKLEEEFANLQLDLARARAAKSQKDKDCEAAEETIKIMTEGYHQLKTTNQELQTQINELGVDLEQVTYERDELSSKFEQATATIDDGTSYTPAPTRPEDSDPDISRVKKIEKELQHLDSLILVHNREPKTVVAKKNEKQERKDKTYTQVTALEIELQDLNSQRKKLTGVPTRPRKHTLNTKLLCEEPVLPSYRGPSLANARHIAAVREDPFPPLAPSVVPPPKTKGTPSILPILRVMASGGPCAENGVAGGQVEEPVGEGQGGAKEEVKQKK